MKILHIGAFQYYFYDEVVAEHFEKLGHVVLRFKTTDYLKGSLGKLETYFSFIGPLSRIMHRDIIKKYNEFKPDLILFWRCTLLDPTLLQNLKRLNNKAILLSYNNDDPFSPLYNFGNLHNILLWRNFIKCVPFYDINAVFRPANIKDYNNAGSKKTILFPPYFIPKLVNKIPEVPKIYDIVFIGHYTPERAQMINFLIDRNVKVKVFGTLWKEDFLSTKYSFERNIVPVSGLEYHKALKSSKIALAFYSKLNRDVYTIRSFEIPPLETVMLSEYTREMEELFIPNKEAVYFSTNEELLEKVQILLNNEELRISIAKNGKKCSYEKKFDVESRVKELIKMVLNV